MGATYSIFSDADSPGWAEALAELLREGSSTRVDIADSLDAAFDGAADVLILNLDRERDTTLSAGRIEALKRRRIIAMAPGADWLCDQLDEIEFRGGNLTGDMTMVVTDSALLGKPSADPIRPFRTVQTVPPEAWTPQTPRVYFSGGIADYRPGVDDILVPEHYEDCAVVLRQASFVFAGVQAHPDEWSEPYRALIRGVAAALAGRPVETLEPIVVERQVHPPGSMRLELEAFTGEKSRAHRSFYFRFERPTAFAATLEHSGSNAVAMHFGGGKKHLHGARVDAEDGKTLTIAANIGKDAIRAVGYRYWLLGVLNFDHENACSAKLTVRYDTGDSGATIRALPGNASLEYVNGVVWDLARAAQTEADAARLAAAREHGFETWENLEAHVAWTPGFDMRGGTVGATSFDARITAQYGESFAMEQLIEYAEDFTDELRLALTDASSGDETFSDEHLLLVLLDDPIAAHALRCAGANTDLLRSQLRAPGGDRGVRKVAKAVSGAVYRANFIGAIGREGTNPANLLAGLLGESCPATNLLKDQGIQQRDIVNYVTHGLPRAVDHQAPGASVFDEQVEQVAQAAFAKTCDDASKYVTLDRLLLALLSELDVARVIRSMGTNLDALRVELHAFIDATLVGAGEDGPQPTRALNRVMQMTVAKARSAGRARATALDVLWALCGERDVPTADLLDRFEIARADVAERMD